MTRFSKRLGAALATTAAVVVLPGLAILPAERASAMTPFNIDPDATGSLAITADARAVEGAKRGEEIIPLAGVTFTVQQVTGYRGEPVSLTTPEGWEAVEGIVAADIADDGNGAVLEDVASGTTDDAGKVTFDDLGLGLYYVTQTGSPEHVVAQAVPFLVTIPYPRADVPGGWRYDVEAFPKSVTATATKSVTDGSAFTLGDRVTWTLEGSVPPAPSGETLTRYVVTDVLDPRLRYLPETVRVTTEPDAGLAAGDYTVVYADADRSLTVELTGAGLAKLAGLTSATVALIAEFETEVTAIGDGTIENVATFHIGEATFERTAATEWGAVEIYKHVRGRGSAPLGGAVFEVYESREDAVARVNAVQILVDEEDAREFTTGEDGLVQLPGFLAGRTVYVVETSAPAGYVASGDVHEVVVSMGPDETPIRLSVPNAQQGGIDLPVLGARGTAVAGLAGLALVGAGAGLAVLSTRRRADGTAR